jgi:azurin
MFPEIPVNVIVAFFKVVLLSSRHKSLNKIQPPSFVSNTKENPMKILSILTIASMLLLASCGGAEKKEESKTADTVATASESATPGIANITVKVTGNTMADMAYEPSSLTVKAGDKVTLTLENTNSMEGMLHNWVLVKLGSGQEVATAAIAAGMDKNYVPENSNVIVASALAKPNETIKLEFVAPAAGSYNYVCTYPGHFPKMIGKLYVE